MSYAPPSACRDFSSWYYNVHNSTSSKPVPKIYPANSQEAKTTLKPAVSRYLHQQHRRDGQEYKQLKWVRTKLAILPLSLTESPLV